MVDLSELEKRTDIVFEDKKLLRQAFVHRSYLNESKERGLEHNERLEFLGDAVLELVVTDYLYKQYPDKPEGELTAIRAALVNTTSLSDNAARLGMNDFLLLSKGESKDLGRARQYILANTYEAYIGAVYLDRGYVIANEFIEKYVLSKTDDIVKNKLWMDAKSNFQEKAQEHDGQTPRYEVVEESGPDHDKLFIVGVYLKDKEVARGEGKSKQDAEQEAAKSALDARGW